MYSGTMLNSGSVKNYVPIGEDGRPVWASADAFRQAIALAPALGRKYADMLAVPRFSKAGETVNWFVPFEPLDPSGHQIVMWNAASLEEKRAAMIMLNDFERRLSSFGRDLQQHALTADDKVFAHFLTGTSVTENLPAVHFPDIDCVYIVDGKPVITFWGFLKRGENLNASPFEALRPKNAPKSTAPKESAKVASVAAPWWKRHLLCLCLLPLLLALLALLGYLLWWWLFARPLNLGLFEATPDLKNWSLEPVKEESITPQDGINIKGVDTTVTPVNGVVDGVNAKAVDGTALNPVATDEENGAQDLAHADPKALDDALAPDAKDDGESAVDDPQALAKANDDATDNSQKETANDDGSQSQDNTPQDQSAQDQDAKDQNAQDEATQDEVSQNQTNPVDLDNAKASQNTDENGNLKLDKAALNAGNVQGLDGSWNTSAGLVDSRTGKPVSIKYKFKDGSGQAEVVRSDGVKCQTSSKGSAVSGALSISGGLASCSDGSSVQLPKVKCTPDANGKTSCVGVYDNTNGKSENVNMDLYR